jgi:regulatory protein
MPPGTITALVVQSGDAQRINVFVDGAFAIGVSLLTLQRQGLYKGQILSEEDWRSLERAESDHKAWESALRLLEVRPRAEREIRDRLRRKQYDAEQIDSVVARLRELELLDDRQFARLWVANRAATKPKGALALRRELLSKGVDRQVAGEVVDAALDAEAETAACEQVARQAFGRYASIADWPTFQRRLGGLLQRRGFGWDTVAPMLKQLWNERGGDPSAARDEEHNEPE